MQTEENLIPVNTLMGELLVPEAMILATCLQFELNKFYVEAIVEWVDCPDLTQPPFYLAAPGLCGNTALLDVGSPSYLFPHPQLKKIYDFKSFLTAVGRSNNDNLIIGASLHQSFTGQLGELIMNATFSPSTEGIMQIDDRSRFIYLVDPNVSKTCRNTESDILYNCNNPRCSIQGNFFISEGKPGRVLKVKAKERRTHMELTEVIQYTLQKYYGDKSALVGLGGVFVVNNGIVKLHVTPQFLETDLTSNKMVHDWLQYHEVPTPLVAVGTIVNKSSFPVLIPSTGFQTDLELTAKHFHAFSLDAERGGHYYTNIEFNNTAEYLGYFCPAKMLYRMDKGNINPLILPF
ncbi:Ester hydrolase C11orf54 [Formica fusca]